jgi:hypothetical protein
MSAWYVLSALGFYPVAPGSTQYVIGTPLFPSAAIALENGKTFTLRADGSAGPYVQGATLNGTAYGNSFLEHAAIADGGELAFELGAEPNTGWGSSEGARPRSSIDEHRIVAAPFIASGDRVFRGSTEVALGAADPGVEIRYTLDGTTPGPSSSRYERPISIDASVTLQATSIVGPAFQAGRELGREAGRGTSPIVNATFRRLADYPRITLSAPYAPQYAAAGDDALIDGLRGDDDFRTTRWQGYRGQNLDVTLDFGAPREIRHVAMGFLQNVGSWILMPRRILIEASDDGVTFVPVGAVENSLPERESKPTIRDFSLDLQRPRHARYLRLRVHTFGKLPAWHPGAGEQAWFFADEIMVR